jgi:hypothetical protein
MPLARPVISFGVVGVGKIMRSLGRSQTPADYWGINFVTADSTGSERTAFSLPQPTVPEGGPIDAGAGSITLVKNYSGTTTPLSPHEAGRTLSLKAFGRGAMSIYLSEVRVGFGNGANDDMTVTLYPPATMYDANTQLTNVTTGETLTIRLPMEPGKTLVIDTQ